MIILGKVNWKELYLDTMENEVSVSYYKLGFSGSGRLEFEDSKGSSDEVWHLTTDYETEVDDWRRICKLGALNLDNLNAAEGKDNSGQVHWKELCFEIIKDEAIFSFYRLGFSESGRLEFEMRYEIEDDAELDEYVDNGRVRRLGALNLDNLKAPKATFFVLSTTLCYRY